jgi:hypothetical protein
MVGKASMNQLVNAVFLPLHADIVCFSISVYGIRTLLLCPPNHLSTENHSFNLSSTNFVRQFRVPDLVPSITFHAGASNACIYTTQLRHFSFVYIYISVMLAFLLALIMSKSC